MYVYVYKGLKPNLLKNLVPFTDDFFDASAKPGSQTRNPNPYCPDKPRTLKRKTL